MINLTLFQVSTLITALVSLFLGIFVYLNGGRNKLSFSWLLTSLFIGLWSIGLFGVVFSTNASSAWFWQYVLDIGGICVPVIFFNFLLYLTKKEKKLALLQIFSLVAGTALIVLNFTDLFKTGVSPKFGINFWIDPGKLYFLFPLFFIVLVFISAFILIKEYRIATDDNFKRQLLYVLIAQIFGFGGGLTDFFPQLFNIYPFGSYFIILYVIFISYAALKHHLFDTKVIATELFTFALWVFLSIKIFFSTGSQDLIINIGIFLSVLLFGILLIRGVLKEVKQREKMERMAEEVKRAYELEKKAKEDIDRAYGVEKKANEELKSLDKAKNQFLAQAQHDLRTPLSIIRGYCDLLIGGTFGKTSKKTSEIIKKIETVTEGKIKDINNFLDVSQFQLGKKIVTLTPGVELNAIFDEISDVLLPTAKSKGIFLKIEKSKDNILVEADREKLKAALFNVIDNSIKYTNDGGVAVKISNDKNVTVEVKDTGIGIPEDKIKTLFDRPFERGERAKKTFTSGMGVGLYLSNQIIKAHNGKIWAESEGEGKGSIFFIELPDK